jgi:glutamate dehydrogenase/leucine dehydrogenase
VIVQPQFGRIANRLGLDQATRELIADLPLGGAKGWIDVDPASRSVREQELGVT